MCTRCPLAVFYLGYFLPGYLLPIINRLLSNKEFLSRPPYAVVLLPSIELCNQVANVFQSLTDHTLAPCVVHKESNLVIHHRYPVIMATPDALFNYGLSALNNVQVVVTDEADFLITGGGDVVWEILSFFKGVDSLKTKKKQAHLARRQKVSRERNALQDRTMSSDHTEQPTKRPRNLTPANQGKFSQAVSVPKRQFVFVAATLPHHGPKAAFNVLKEWMPEAEYVSTDLAHHPVPTVGIFYVQVREPGKLPELLRCLNALVGVVKRPVANDKKKIIGEENVCSNSNVSKQKELSSLSFPQDQNKSYDESCLEPIRFSNLRVLVFANSSKMAERAFCFLSDIREMEGNCFIPWKHVTQNGVTTTTRREKGDDNDDFFEDSFNSFVTQTGDKDVWKGTVGLIHKKLPVNERSQTLLKFKSGELKVLICTDLASRGLDIPDVSHVIQLDFAPNAAAVLHRTGRTARAGSSGKVINFVTEHDEDLSKAIQACEENSHSNSYECHFSRNRQFRWRLKKKQLRKMNR